MPPAVLDEGFNGSMDGGGAGVGDCTRDGIEDWVEEPGAGDEPQPGLESESGDELWLLVSSRGML